MSAVCLNCGVELAPADVRACKGCHSYQGDPCGICGVLLPKDATRCNECETFVAGKECSSCGALVPNGTKRCRICNTFTDWRRFVPKSEIVLALIATILSLSVAILTPVREWMNDRSRTDVHVMGLESVPQQNGARSVPLLTVLVKATNDGKRPVLIKSAWIQFPSLPKLDPQPLKILELKEKFLEPGHSIDLHLFASEVKGGTAADLATRKATITLCLEENTRGEYAPGRASDVVDGTLIEGWLKNVAN